MLDLFRRNPRALVLAVLMHLVIVLLMVFGLDWLKPPKPRVGQPAPVQATLTYEDPVAKRQAEEARKAEAKRKAEEAARAKAQREAKAKAQREAKAKAEREAKAKAEREAKAKAKAEREAKAQREAKAKAEREAKAKAEREAKAKAEREAKAKAEREARERAEAERRRKEAEAAQAQKEADMAAALEAEGLAREKVSVTAAIKAKVERNWLRPPGSEKLKCQVRVRLGANGSVLLVQIVESSGNGAFDRSVEAAVRKADPLPMPESADLLKDFRELNFVFDPDNN